MPLPGRGPVTGRSSMNTDPLLAGNRPATIRNSVVLPQPLGPNTEMKLNSGNSMLMSLSAATPGNQCLVNSVDLVCINCLLTRSTLILAQGRAGFCVESRARSGWTFKPYPTPTDRGNRSRPQTGTLLSEVSRMALDSSSTPQ